MFQQAGSKYMLELSGNTVIFPDLEKKSMSAHDPKSFKPVARTRSETVGAPTGVY